ncbi:LysR family transcriptional regulator [Streptomyces sp. NPDC014864]|uniref:LysR family transcriptional regulator n=1 Tax=Streptomyces sp. NPDC014864 TaxID=3364924 RepID=UPI0036FD33AC
MINIYETEFRRADLNLLVVFSAVLREKSVSRAAQELRLSQAAVSAALGRLRKLFGDVLFVRTGTGMEPTPRAMEIARQVEPALHALHGAITGAAEFAPDRADRTFPLGMSDDIEAHLMPRLVGRWREHSGLRFVARQANRTVVADMLDRGEIDLGVAVAPVVTADHRQEALFTSGYACVFDPARLELRLPLTREDYLAHPHVLVSRDGRRGIVDDLLEAQGLTRRVITATTHFAGAVVMLKSVPAIATVPSHAAAAFAHTAGLAVSPPPIAMPDYVVSMVWHSALADDAAHAWLRQTVRECVDGSTYRP